VAFAVVLLASIAQSARANLYMDVQYASGGAAGSTTYYAKVDAFHENFVLNVYAMITDATPNANVDQFKLAAANFFVASSTLKGDVSWGSWSSNVGGTFAVSGSPFTSSFGALGLGGTSTGDTVASHWYIPTPTSAPIPIPASAGIVVPGVGVEYFLGSLNVSFTGYALPGGGATAPLDAIANGHTGIATKEQQWIDSSGTYALAGNASNVGQGNTHYLYNLNGAGLNFNFGVGPTPAALSASLGINGPTTGLGGTSLALTGAVANSGGASAYPLNWGSSTTAGITANVAPPNGSGLGGNVSTILGGTLPLPANLFGPASSTVTFTGTDAALGTPAPGSPIAANLFATIIGKGTKLTADGFGIPGGTYGILLQTQTTVSNLAGLTSTLGNSPTSFGIGQTTAALLTGTLAASNTITETWRSRASNETPTGAQAAGGSAAGFLPLVSDVVNLNGISGGTNCIYALQMTYDPNELGGIAAAHAAASGGFLYLGYRGADGKWHNATTATQPDGNTGTGAGAVANFQGSFAVFTATNGVNLQYLLGSWGVDPVNNDVWALVDHDAEFAVAVPEPGTIALLAGGLAALGFAYHRRKAKLS
jgi:hypothetical protein